MKTNQIMTRQLDKFIVYQRTCDGMFNATSLLNQWNEYTGQQKQIVHYTENKSTEETIQALLKDLGFKERNSVLLQSRGKNGGTWLHPYLFIDFAMWINPIFKVKVLKFVYDELISLRHDAGDGYKELSSAIASLPDVKHDTYSKVATAVNYIVFNEHKEDLRNNATIEQLKLISDIQKNLVYGITMGFYPNTKVLIDGMRKMWDIQRAKEKPIVPF